MSLWLELKLETSSYHKFIKLTDVTEQKCQRLLFLKPSTVEFCSLWHLSRDFTFQTRKIHPSLNTFCGLYRHLTKRTNKFKHNNTVFKNKLWQNKAMNPTIKYISYLYVQGYSMSLIIELFSNSLPAQWSERNESKNITNYGLIVWQTDDRWTHSTVAGVGLQSDTLW